MKLRTLGGLALEGSAFNRSKPLLLLAYVALEGPVTRRVLADLFFSGAKNSRDSLSTALRHLRTAASGLVAFEGESVRCTCSCDAADLLRLIEEGKVGEVTELYGGAFLKGLGLKLDGELEEWVFGTREAIAARVRHTQLLQAEGRARRGDFTGAALVAEQAYLLPGAPEPDFDTFRRLHALLIAGESTYVQEVRQEAESFGMELASDRDSARVELLGSTADRTGAAEGPVPNNIPASAGNFVGRDLEISEVGNLLERPDVRLVTLVGSGGSGKSRLALEIARNHLASLAFPDGIFFVALDAITSPALIGSAIAEGIGLSLQGAGAPQEQVERFIGQKRVLLVLDNFEQLIEAAGVTGELLTACENLSLLVTSRERLHTLEEWLFPIEGLAYPNEEVPLDQARHYDAVRLFILRAKHQMRRFEPSAQDLEAIVEICQLVGGTPLALELAATWIPHLGFSEIVDELEQSVDILEANLRDAPARHRSLRATFEHSWSLLTERESQVLRRLGVFTGGFRREAAGAVAGATLPLLARLVDKSLLRIGKKGRYDRHPLMHQFTEEKLELHPREARECRQRHIEYFCSWLSSRLHEMLGGDSTAQALDAVEEELPNLRSALLQAAELGKGALVEEAIEGIHHFAEYRAHFQETAHLVRSIVARLDRDVPDSAPVAAALNGSLGLLQYRTGDNQAGLEYALEAVKGLSGYPLQPRNIGLWAAWYGAGLTSTFLGEYGKGYFDRANQVAEQDHERALQAGDELKLRRAYTLLGISLTGTTIELTQMGRYEQATEYLDRAQPLLEEIGSPYLSLLCMRRYELSFVAGELAAAQEWLERGLAAARTGRHSTMIDTLKCCLARVYYLCGSKAEAERLAGEVRHSLAVSGDKYIAIYLAVHHGWSGLNERRPSLAAAHFRDGIELATQIKAFALAMEPYLGLAVTLASAGALPPAARILGFVVASPGSPAAVRAQATRMLAELSERAVDICPVDDLARSGAGLSLLEAHRLAHEVYAELPG